MTDDESQSDGKDGGNRPRPSTAENWYAAIEFIGWVLEPLFWIGRILVAGIVALLHGCN